MIKSNDEVYPTLQRVLENASKPMTAPDLMGVPDVFTVVVEKWGKDKVKAAEKLSDTLGFMWRRGVLDRFPAPPSHSMARFAYSLKNRFGDDGELKKIIAPSTKNKGDMVITERDGEVVIEMKDFTIVIKPK